MARAITTYPFEALSGRVGNGVWQNYADGPRIREYVYTKSPQTPLQVASQDRTTRVSRTWAQLDDARFARWQAFASDPRLWAPGGRAKRVGRSRAYNLFFKLASQAVRIDPARDLLSFDPPVRRFMGDGVGVSVGSLSLDPAPASPQGEGVLVFASDRANAPGVVTELRTQSLKHGHCLPSPDKYRFAAFHAFTAGEALAVAMPSGTYACAYAFYDAQTGQQTELVEIGVVVLSEAGDGPAGSRAGAVPA